MNSKPCCQYVLEDSLLNDENGRVDIEFEQHLEHCQWCKNNLLNSPVRKLGGPKPRPICRQSSRRKFRQKLFRSSQNPLPG